jgi:hypothetical protein
MNSKAIVFIVVVIAIGLAIYFLPDTDSGIPAPTYAPQGDGMQQAGAEHEHTHAPLPDIDSLRVTVQDSTGAELATLSLVPHQSIALPGTEYSLHLAEFYTHFMMEESGPANVSPYPENPAARIEIQKGGEAVDYTWTFERIPYFRMNSMGGPHNRENTGLAFAILEVYGLEVPSATPNP